MSEPDGNTSESSAQPGYHQPNPSFILEQPDYPEHDRAPQDHGMSVERAGSAIFDLSSETNPMPDSPIFLSSRPSHLPTPQSPNTLGQYVVGQYILDSPISHLQSTSGALPSQNTARPPYKMPVELQFHSPPNVNQILTPESSPNLTRGISPPRSISAPQFGPIPFRDETPRPSSSSITTSLEAGQGVSPSATSEITKSTPLSSPFMAKLSLSDVAKTKKSLKSQTPSPDDPVQVEDLFYSEANLAISTPPLSPQPHCSDAELERIRLQTLHNKIAHIQETERRRPDYLQRSKRSLSDEEKDHPLPGVEIAVSPHKGRRLKLFQETSEESFEESLMAGGYGRYRTTDWLQQLQPTSGSAESSSTISLLEEQALSPRELKKRKRLAVFQDRPSPPTPASKLSPVKMGSKGRVLLDMSIEAPESMTQANPGKKRAGRRKNAVASTPVSNQEPLISIRPNWPDAEFPWKLRLQERAEIAKVEEAERLRWIEKFLDRDSDEDEETEDDPMTWTIEAPPVKAGRGKMVPLPADPAIPQSHRTFHPSDPADARVALMSKRCVRALTHRKARREARRRTDNDNGNDEVICNCNGRDDGRDLVLCESCEVWYHLDCIGIKNVAELGREEDPWYCDRCYRARTRTPSPPPIEPTFMKETDEAPGSFTFDPPFFQSLQDFPWNSHSSSTKSAHTELFPVEYSLNDPKHGPSTPQGLTHGSRLYTTPGPHELFSYEDSPFDPTSTPSRGIKLGPPPSFTTPKNNVWSMRANGLFQTPSKPGRLPHGPGPIDSLMLSEPNSVGPLDGYRGMPGIEDSPVRRTKTSVPAKSALQRFATSRTPSPPTGTRALAQPFSTADDWRCTDGNETELSSPAIVASADREAISEGKGEPVSTDVGPSSTRDPIVLVD